MAWPAHAREASSITASHTRVVCKEPRLGDERAPDPRRDRDGDDHRDDDGVVARHLEHHDDAGHDAAGPRSDHRRHAHDRGRRRVHAGAGKGHGRDGRERRAERRAEIERGRKNAP